MAYSRVSYTADGSTTEYSIPFAYLTLSNVSVTVDGYSKQLGEDYRVEHSKLTFVVPPPLGCTILLKRKTPRGENERIVQWKDPCPINEAALNDADLQMLYIIQEVLDDVAEGVGVGGGSGGGGVSLPSDVRSELDQISADLIEALKTANDAALAEVQARTQALLSAHSGLVADLIAASGQQNAAVIEATKRLSNADAALAQQVSVLNAQVADANAKITAEQTARTTADTAQASRLTTVEASTGSLSTRLSAVEGAYSGGQDNEALAFRVTTLESTVNTPTTGLSARITAEETTRAGAVDALASRVSTLEAATAPDVSNLTALINQEQAARTDADTALAGTIQQVKTTADSAKATAESEVAARVSAVSALSTRIDNVNVNLNSVSGQVSEEATARAQGDSAIKSDLALRWGVKLDANGRVVGRINLTGTSSSSSLDFSTNAIRLTHPAAPDVFFGTLTRASRAVDTRAFNTGSGFSFNHAPAVRLYCPAASGAASNPNNIVNVRNSSIVVQLTSNIVGSDITSQIWQTVYYQRNGSGPYLVLGARVAHFGQQFVTIRGSDIFTDVLATDYFDFYVAPCDANGNIVTSATVTSYLDVLAFNW